MDFRFGKMESLVTFKQAVEMKARAQWVEEVKKGKKVELVNIHVTKEVLIKRHQESQSFSEKVCLKAH